MSDLTDEIRQADRDVRAEKFEITDLKRELEARQKDIDKLERELGASFAIQKSTKRVPKWLVRAPRGRQSHGILTLQLTDTHFDEVVNPEEMMGANAYNRKIAEMRLRRWAEKAIVLTRDYIKGVEIDGVTLFATGDILSGDIHEELKHSNEDHLYSSAVYWTERLIAALRMIVEEFGVLHVVVTVGNHGRSTVKPVYKGRVKSNIEYLVWHGVARAFADNPNVTFQIPESMDAYTVIYQTRFLSNHGDQFRGGSGISGALAPLMLGQHKKSMRQMVLGRPYDHMIIGHWHQYLTLPGLTVGGSMKGLDEFAAGINVRPEQPQQALWVTTPEHGVTVRMPILVSKRSEEGW